MRPTAVLLAFALILSGVLSAKAQPAPAAPQKPLELKPVRPRPTAAPQPTAVPQPTPTPKPATAQPPATTPQPTAVPPAQAAPQPTAVPRPTAVAQPAIAQPPTSAPLADESGDLYNTYYPTNRPPLLRTEFVALPLGAVKPQGWLRDQLVVQANGLTGHLDEFWPSLSQSAWDGGEGESWERGPYYLDGLVPLAYLLDDARLKQKAQRYVDWILSSQKPSGWFGPTKNTDRWPLSVAMKVLTQYQEATGDPRVVPFLQKYFEYIRTNPPDWPDKEWRGVRAMENAVTGYWLYRRTADPKVLEAIQSIQTNSFKWIDYFTNFPFTTDVMQRGIQLGHPSHVVNIAMATKYPGLWFQQSRNEAHRDAVLKGIASLDEHHGQVAGRFAGDEHLSGRKPTQGTELCGVVEYMFSLENLVEVIGEAAFADRLETLAYNALPGTCTPDFWAHQYDQQSNQALVSVAKRRWSTNGDQSNIYGLEPNFGCCTSNMHQGWPKFVSHMWMATHDNGLVAVAYGPSVVTAKVADGKTVRVVEQTNYPFEETIRFIIQVDQPTTFPLYFRMPYWAKGARFVVRGETFEPEIGSFAGMEKQWNPNEVVTVMLPMPVQAEKRYNDAIALRRGPLYFSLKIGEAHKKIKQNSDKFPSADWEIQPTTAWNYGLILLPRNSSEFVKVEMRKIGPMPFKQEDAPVVLKVQGRQIPEWTLADNSAGETPKSPIQSTQPVTALELIPYGCTRLRMTEFPVVNP
jgi:hypothetical protein